MSREAHNKQPYDWPRVMVACLEHGASQIDVSWRRVGPLGVFYSWPDHRPAWVWKADRDGRPTVVWP